MWVAGGFQMSNYMYLQILFENWGEEKSIQSFYTKA
jgi:hypothetical protein